MPTLVNLRRMPRSAQATALLVTTAFAVTATLGCWLVCWLLFIRPKVHFVDARASESPLALRWLSGLLPSGLDRRDGRWESIPLDSLTKFGSYLNDNADRPMILYLAAPVAGTRRAARRDSPGATLADKVWKGIVRDDGGALSLRGLIETCLSREGKAKVLLIVDPGRAGLDSELGLSGSQLAREMKDAMARPDSAERHGWDRRWRNFGIFWACSPEQFSWPIEGEGRTVFDHFLNQAIAQPRKLRKTIEIVRADVANWVSDHIAQAAQAPFYLGDPDLDFFVPGAKSPAVTAGDSRSPDEDSTWKRLQAEYRQHAQHTKRRPYRFAPLAWRDYQEHLLQAERLFRARRFRDADVALAAADALRKGELSVPDLPRSFGSLALGLCFETNPGDWERLWTLNQDFGHALERGPAPPAAAPAQAAPPAGQSQRGPAAAPPAAAPAQEAKAAGDKQAPAPPGAGTLPDAEPREPVPVLFQRAPGDRSSYPNPWNDYVEGQLIDWINAYRKLLRSLGKPDPFSPERIERFARAIRLRRRAEQLAAVALDRSNPLRGLIEEGDRFLREAEDLLFIEGGDAQKRAVEELNRAEEAYERAQNYADALDLVGQVQSELPFLGAWYVHQAAREGRESVGALDAIARAVDALATLLNRALPTAESERSDVSDQVRKVGAALGVAYGHLQEEFDDRVQRDWSSLEPLESGAPAKPPVPEQLDWRQLDALLLVPGRLTTDRRAALVQRVRSFQQPWSPQPAGVAADAGATAQTEGQRELLRGVATGTIRGQVIDQGTKAIASSTPAHSSPPPPVRRSDHSRALLDQDKSYPRIEYGMARLAEIVEAIDKTLAAGSVSPLGQRYEDLMRWMAGRLLEDADPGRARRFLEAPRAPGGDLEARRRYLAENPWADRFGTIDRNGTRLELGVLPLDVAIQLVPDAPKGLACLLVRISRPDEVELTYRDAPIDSGIGAPVGSGKTETITLAVNRRFPDPPAETAPRGGPTRSTTVALEPILFYRGRELPGKPSELTLDPPQFIVRLESDKTTLKKRLGIVDPDPRKPEKEKAPRRPAALPPDQFDDPRHQGLTGYAYPGCNHACLLTIEYRPDYKAASPVMAEVEWGHGVENERQGVELKPKVKNEVGKYEIDFRSKEGGEKLAPGGEFLRIKKLVVKVWLKTKGADRPIHEQTLRIYEVNPAHWYEIQDRVDPPLEDQDTGPVRLTVSRSRDDHVVAVEGVRVQPPEGFIPLRGDDREFPLKRGESHSFRFRPPPADSKTKTWEFFVCFHGGYKLKHSVTIEGTRAPAAPPPPQAPAPQAVAQ